MNFILRKISKSFDANGVKDAMKNLQFKNVATSFIKATPFKTSNPTSNLFLVQFTHYAFTSSICGMGKAKQN